MNQSVEWLGPVCVCVCMCGYSGYVGAVKGGCCEFGGPVFEFAEFICRCFSENIFFARARMIMIMMIVGNLQF